MDILQWKLNNLGMKDQLEPVTIIHKRYNTSNIHSGNIRKASKAMMVQISEA